VTVSADVLRGIRKAEPRGPWAPIGRCAPRADLSGADLRGADLRGANLGWANLGWADLSGADLGNTCLDPSTPLPEIPDAEILAAGLEIVGDRVYGWRTERSQHVGSTRYAPRPEPYEAPWFSSDSSTPCHPGIYLAGREWMDGEYPDADLVRCYCLRSELLHAGDKWRCRRLWIVGQEVAP
jgi:hypothetical protein